LKNIAKNWRLAPILDTLYQKINFNMNLSINLLVINSLSIQTFEEELNKLFNHNSPLSRHFTRRAEASDKEKVIRSIYR